jgi:hypothetical protein
MGTAAAAAGALGLELLKKTASTASTTPDGETRAADETPALALAVAQCSAGC